MTGDISVSVHALWHMASGVAPALVLLVGYHWLIVRRRPPRQVLSAQPGDTPAPTKRDAHLGPLSTLVQGLAEAAHVPDNSRLVADQAILTDPPTFQVGDQDVPATALLPDHRLAPLRLRLATSGTAAVDGKEQPVEIELEFAAQPTPEGVALAASKARKPLREGGASHDG